MNKYEQDLFLSLCHYMDPDKYALETLLPDHATAGVLGELFFNRMAAIAYGVLRENSLLGLVNREFRNSLAASYESNIIKNKSYFRCLANLSEILAECKGKYAMLKGALLCQLYPEGYRTANDVDLLVRPKDVTEIGNVLKFAGFKQGHVRNGEFIPANRREIIQSKMMRGETVPYVLEVNLPYLRFFEVDINFSLDYKNAELQPLEVMLKRAKAISAKQCSIITLDEYDFFIHLCSHLFKEATTLPWVQMNRDMTLYKYCDIYMFLNEVLPENLDELWRRADDMQMEEACSCAILWTNALLPVNSLCAVSSAKEKLQGREQVLHEVVDPQLRKTLAYIEKDVKTRFFTIKRSALLEEI